MNTHRLKLSFEDGAIGVKLICLGECHPANMCGECGRTVDDKATEPCDCCELVPEPCYLAQWVEASDPADVLEWLEGEVTIEVNGIFEGDAPRIEVYEPERALAHLTFPA